MSSASTHVLDAVLGTPAVGLAVELVGADGRTLQSAVTDADGRVGWSADLSPGVHTLIWATGPWFAAAGRETFFPTVSVTFTVETARPHVHVALLLSPFAYTAYRGS